MHEDPIFQVVGHGEAAQAVTAYLAAAHGAAMLHSALAGVGLADAVLFIVPGVSDTGEPMIRVTLTLAGATQLEQRLRGDHETTATMKADD
jgi:hypothetical protein